MTTRTDSDRDVREEFDSVVNMSAQELQQWLESEESRSVGITDSGPKSSSDGEESTGHESGRRIVELLGMKQEDLDDDDRAHMRKVVGYVHRHLGQRPCGDVETSRWRYSLMNWGHDPLKD